MQSVNIRQEWYLVDCRYCSCCGVLSAVGMTFITKNVLSAVARVKNTDGLRYWLGVTGSKRDKIKRLFSNSRDQVKAYIDYFMEHDPVASWRAVVVALDAIREKKVADAIRHLAEPITGRIWQNIAQEQLECMRVCVSLIQLSGWPSTQVFSLERKWNGEWGSGDYS